MGAASADCVAAAADVPKDGKYDVLFPVGLPDEGTFDWLNQFLEKNRKYTEISDRAILNWCVQSGLRRPDKSICNDKPDMSFGVPMIEDLSVHRTIASVLPALQRHFVVMEVKGNLNAEDRKASISRFGPHHNKIALVVMGDPPSPYKKWVQEMTLDAKQKKAEQEAKRKRDEELKKKKMEKAMKIKKE